MISSKIKKSTFKLINKITSFKRENVAEFILQSLKFCKEERTFFFVEGPFIR